MFINYRKITVIRDQRPRTGNINDNLQWFGSSLGLFNVRDKDKSCFRIFIELFKATKKNHSLSSDELATLLNLSRGTVVHHLGKLSEAGMIITYKNRYMLRVRRLKDLVDEIESDIIETLREIRLTAEYIDERLSTE